MCTHFSSRPLPLTRKLLPKRHTFAPTLSITNTLPHAHAPTHTYTCAHKYASVHGKRAYSTVQTHIHSKNKTSPCALNPHIQVHIQTHPSTSSSIPLPLDPPTHDLRYPQSQIIISARAARDGHKHARTRALPSPRQLGRLRAGRRLQIPGVVAVPRSAFSNPPLCWRRGEEGSWNNKGKLGRAQGGAAPAGPRGEPCSAGALEAAGSRAPGAGARAPGGGARGGASA